MSEAYASMEVSQVMTENVITCSTEHTCRDACIMMTENKIGAIVVVDEDYNVLGMLSERDVVSNVVAEGKDGSTLVRDAMNAPAIGVQMEYTLDQVIRRMTEFRFRRLPVLRGTELVGIISQTDMLKHYPALIASNRW